MQETTSKKEQSQNVVVEQVEKKEWATPEILTISTNETEHNFPPGSDQGGLSS